MTTSENESLFIHDRRASSHQEEAAVGDKEQATQNSDKPLAEQLTEEQEKAQAYLASWQRTAADFQNYKRRMEQERDDVARLANAALIVNLLPLVDDFERALDNLDEALAGLTWMDGIRLMYRKFQALLEMSGVSPIPAEGEPFDPNVHEAVAFGEGEDGKVIKVVQQGYKLGERILRPAMVVVGKEGG